MRILILGGTTEASALAALADRQLRLRPAPVLAGRTSDPRPLPIPTRIGGFGGVEGLARFLAHERIEAVVDATHPFAAVMSRNAAEACAQAGVPLLALRRPPWKPQDGDRWIDVAPWQRPFMRSGRHRAASSSPSVGSNSRPSPLRRSTPISCAPSSRSAMRCRCRTCIAIRDRAPFDEAAERALMERERVEVVVTKNSGGAATYPKIAAARALGLPVIVVARPDKPGGVEEVASAEAALDWLERLHGQHPVEPRRVDVRRRAVRPLDPPRRASRR